MKPQLYFVAKVMTSGYPWILSSILATANSYIQWRRRLYPKESNEAEETQELFDLHVAENTY